MVSWASAADVNEQRGGDAVIELPSLVAALKNAPMSRNASVMIVLNVITT